MTPPLTQTNIENGLRELGLREGDIVLLHSSLASLGRVKGGADALVDAFLAVIGKTGTLVVPTFGALGVVTDIVRDRPDAMSSIHPKASVAAIGPDAARLCANHWKAELAHGPDTPYTRIAELDGSVCLLGVDQDRNTTLHTVEELLRLPYLEATEEVTFETPEGAVTKAWPFFPGPHRDFIGLDRPLRESGKMKMGRIGDSVVRLIKSRDLIEIALAIGEKDTAFVLCDNPHCADCVAQRAALRQDRLSREPFKLAASAALAGRYAEEIADNCRRAGIRLIELDCLKGEPVDRIKFSALEKAIATIRENQCEVAALRCPCAPAAPETLFDLAAANKVPRVVMPLSGEAASLAGIAAKKGIRLSLCNAAIGAEAASALLLNADEKGASIGFAFDAAAFARAGENPFLFSYKRKLRRFVDQLDVADATFDGAPQPLARGNAEIKEMISILRCASFDGFLVLAAGNRFVGSLEDAACRLEDLLDGM